MKRSDRLKLYCEGRKKNWVAQEKLGIPPQMMTYLFGCDIDDLVARIDSLPIHDDAPIPRRQQKGRAA